MVGFFGGVGYFGVGFFGGVVQVVGFVWHGSGGLWCGDCCPVWWKSALSCGGCGKSTRSCVCGSVVGSDGSPLVIYLFIFGFFGICGVFWFGLI